MQFHVATMIGRAALRLVDRLGSIGLLLYQVASCMWSGQFRMRVLVEQIAKIGVQSQPVVIITGAFTGFCGQFTYARLAKSLQIKPIQ